MAGNISVDKYLVKLSDRTPAPGGGSAAALTGALGAALISMAGKYMVKRCGTAKLRNKIPGIVNASERAMRRLNRLMAEDELAYARLAKEIKKHNKKNIMRLYKAAIGVPLEVCSILAESASRCEEVSRYCRSSLVSDIAEAAVLIEAGFISAKFNAEINLSGISDSRYTDKVKGTLESGEAKVRAVKRRVLAATGKVIKDIKRGKRR